MSALLTRTVGVFSGAISSRTADKCHRGLDSIFSSYYIRSKSNIGTLTNPRLGFRSLQQSFYSSLDEDDDGFAELGAPVDVAHKGGTVPKLMTEKREPFKKDDPTRKSSSASRSPSNGRPNSTASPSPPLKNKGAQTFRNPNVIVVENVPSTVDIYQLKKAASVFGVITTASMSSGPNKLGLCSLEFENLKSYGKAVSVGEIWLGDLNLPVRPLHESLLVTTIRICNVSAETSDVTIHSMCMSCGPLEGLVRTEKGVVVAIFVPKNNSDAEAILAKLNSTIVDECKWTAHVQASNITDVNVKADDCDEDRHKLGPEIASRLDELRFQVCMQKICVEDLTRLHLSIMQLERRPKSMS